MTSPLQPILAGLLDAFEPLERALHDSVAFGLLVRNVGWDKTVDEAALQQGSVGEVAAAASGLLTSGRTLIGALGDDQDGSVLLQVLDVLADTRDLVDGLRDLDVSGLPDALADTDFWAALALDLPEYLLVRYLEHHHAVLFALLMAAGVIEQDPTEPTAQEPGRVVYLRRSLVWDRLGPLVSDPTGHLADLYHWDDGQPFAHSAALDALARIGASTGVPFERLTVRPRLVDDFYGTTPAGSQELSLPLLKGVTETGFAELGAVLAPLPATPGGALDSLFVGNLTWGTVAGRTELRPGWMLAVTGSADATGAVGLLLSPGSADLVSGALDQRYEIAVEGTPTQPWHLIGAAGGTRLDVNGLRIALAFEIGDEPEVVLEVSALPGAGRGGLTLVVQTGDADSFLRSLLGPPLLVDADLAVRWSSRTGVGLSGGGLYVTIPLDKTLGPLTVYSLGIGVALTDGEVSVPIGATLGLALGPFAVRVEDIGLAFTARPGAEDALAAGLGLGVGFTPPTAIGFSIDIADVVTGGGIIGHEPEIGRWWGGLAVQVLAVGLQAVVVVDTRIPGDPDGWSFFASISATFPSLPLGFGFFLSGVGGLVCLNRCLDAQALAAGLKNGAVDALLFPDDPLHDAPLIAASIDDWFPPAAGSSVFAVAVQIDWGTPKALVRGQLGVALTLPDLEIALLGSLSMVLPDDTAPEVELHLDSLGLIDPAAATVWIVASLYDSSLVGTFQLSGDMATYVSVGAQPYFLLAVGGYHPAFVPPGYLPAAVTQLTRAGFEVALSDALCFGVAGYVAVTSNTLQFGALAWLEARTEYLLTTYSATGELGFDVLLTFSPFAFIVDAHVSIDVSTGDKELFGAELEVHLEGPRPWYATAHGEVEFFGLNIHFDVSFGGAEGAETPPQVNVLDEVVAALAAAASWHEVAPSSEAVLFASQTDQDDGPLRVRPDSDLEVRQSTAPLDRTLDIYGAYAVDGPSLLALQGAGIDAASDATTWEATREWFAPAQFDVMNRTEKLAAPSYEEMIAGAVIRSGTADVGQGSQSVSPDPEVRILEPDTTRLLGRVPFTSSMDVARAAAAMGAPGRRRQAVSPRFAVGETTWTRIDPVDGTPIGRPGTYTSTLTRLRSRRTFDPAARMAPSVSARTT